MRERLGVRSIACVSAFGLALGLLGCAPSNVQTTEAYAGAKLPRPDIVVVNDFAVTSESVALDRGILARAERTVEGASAEDQRQIGYAVAEAVSEALVAELRAVGLPAARASAAAVRPGATSVTIDGDLLSVDQGNRTRRNLIGLGAGESRVAADTTVVYGTADGRRRTLLGFQADAESGRKPGAAETMGVGAVAGRLAASAALTAGGSVVSETMGDTVEADARRMAKAIAEKIEAFAVEEGWIAARR